MKPFKTTVRRLERELLKKQKELDELEQQNNLLRIRDGILTGYSINLAWLRDHAAGESGAGSLASAFSHDTTSMTEQQLAAEYATSVQQLALQLSLYRAEQQVPPGLSACSMRHETPVQKMQDIISRIQRMRATLALSGRSDLLRLQYIGQLSLLQMAQLHVVMWPFVPNLTILTKAAMARLQQSDEQQQQQQLHS
ncbi:hypothetical protein OEZ86_003969 [Tetradesmus obliquus]|nr:hypothetical protein OEZ86_003969 [Tetradesmus obliquus]